MAGTRSAQHKRVLAMLKRGPRCGVDFIEAKLPSYPKRIHRLRHIYCCPKGVVAGCQLRHGYNIVSERCTRPDHYHEHPNWVYRLVDLDQPWDTSDVEIAAAINREAREPEVDPEFEALIAAHGPARAAMISAGITWDHRVDGQHGL